jgi:TadE-like protein
MTRVESTLSSPPRSACLGRRLGARARQAGATMVEFAIISPFAILAVLGIIQAGLMFNAKQIMNEAAFLAARAGAVQNAQLSAMQDVMVKALIPFYQDTTNGDDLTRLGSAWLAAKTDTLLCIPFVQCNLKLEICNPTSAAFDDFGVTSSVFGSSHTYIPNDNLEYRPHGSQGQSSGLSIQDANALKIKVTYGYPLKVPLMQSVVNAVMCGIQGAIDGFDKTSESPSAGARDCATYYSQGRIPIVTYATVQMQSPAWRDDIQSGACN